jgi:hypothetical protein
VYDSARASHVAGIMPAHHLPAGSDDVRGRVRIGVTTSHCDPPATCQQRQRTHSRAGYPHKVDWAGIVGGKKLHRSGS